MYFRRPYAYAHSSVNPQPQSAASPYMVPTCPPGYTTTAVKKGPDGTIYSYTCAQYSSRAGQPICPAGFTMTKQGNQFTCTRIYGVTQLGPGPLPPPPPPKRNPQPNPQCQPGQFYSEDLGGCYWPGGGSVAFKPKRSVGTVDPSFYCPPGMTWTEDLGCVTIPPVPKFPSSLPPAPTCPPGMTWTEDLGCVDMTPQRTKRSRNPPAPWPGQTESEFCPDGWVFKTGQSCQPTEYPPHPLMDKNDAWVLVPKYGYGGWGPKSGMPASYQGSVWERYSEWRKDFPHVAKNVLGPRPKTDTGWTSVVAYSKKSGWMWWMVRAKYANFGTHPLPPPVPPSKPKRAKYYPPLPEPIP